MSAEHDALFTELAPLLDSPKPKGNGKEFRLMSYCPGHNDGAKSGRAGPGDQGRSLSLSRTYGLQPFCSCEFKTVVGLLRARRTGPAPARTQGQQSERQGRGPMGPPKIAYEYRDVAGELVSVKARWEETGVDDAGNPVTTKTFKWRLPDSQEYKGWEGKFHIQDMPLWGAEQIPKHEGRIWFVEGEKAAGALRSRQELAVCLGGGAGQKDFGDALLPLTGRTVLLWPDNDELGRSYMARIKAALAPIAGSVLTVTAPVPPKGDAYDYFAAGGTIENLLANVIDKPTVDIVTSDHFVVRIPVSTGVVAFEFEDLVRSRGTIDCELTIRHLSPIAEQEPYSLRINLLSASARGSLETALNKQFGREDNWTTTVSTAWARARETMKNTDRGYHISAAPRPSTTTLYTINPLMPNNEHTIYFGDGSGGKTYALYSQLLELAMLGVGEGQFLGMNTVSTGGVLIVDWETRDKVWWRLRRLAMGHPAIGPWLADDMLNNLPIHVWPGAGSTLPDMADAIKRYCDKWNIGTIGLDSAASACGGEPETAKAALDYCNAVDRIGRTFVTLAHVSDEEGKRPFGCHDEATEVLTRRGWVRHAELSPADEVAAYNTATRVLEWQVPTVFHRYRYDGELVSIRGASLDVMVTPNHRMWVRPSYETQWRETTAGALNGTTVALPYASGLAEAEAADANEDFLDYLGWWIAEGHLDGNAPLITQAVGPLADRFVQTTEALGFSTSIVRPEPRSGERQCWQVRARGAGEFGRWLAEECGRGAANKHLPDVVWCLNRASMRRLLFALMEGDGHWYREGSGTYSTSSMRLADDVQRLAILAGFSAVLRPLGKGAPHHHARFMVAIGSRKEIEVRESRHLSRSEYHGDVYCLTVPNGAYVTRRNGYMAVTMNSKFWHNEARRTWFVKRDDAEESDHIDVAFHCRKVNDGRRPRPILFGLDFEGDDGPVTVAIQGNRNVPSLADNSARAKIHDVLRGGAATFVEIAAATELSADTVKSELTRGKNSQYVIVRPGQKGPGGFLSTWGLAAKGG